MAQWQPIQIQRENGEAVKAQAPIIVSASRSTKRQLILDEVTRSLTGKRFIKLN